jgi:hypothetical protein
VLHGECAGCLEDGGNLPGRHGDGEVVWRLGVAACGGVLAGEVISGGGSEVLGLQGGKGEVRAAPIGEGRAQRGRSLKRGERRHSDVNLRQGGWLRCSREGGGIVDG